MSYLKIGFVCCNYLRPLQLIYALDFFFIFATAHISTIIRRKMKRKDKEREKKEKKIVDINQRCSHKKIPNNKLDFVDLNI